MKHFCLVIFLLLGIAITASAQIKQLTMRVEGMTWNFWAYGVEQHLGRQVGVQKVHVTLIDGKVEITPKPDGKIDPIQILKATYDSGVSVAEMQMVARGQIMRDSSGGVVFVVGTSESFPIVPNDKASELQSFADLKNYVTLAGTLYQKQKNEPKQLSFTVLEIQKKEWIVGYLRCFCVALYLAANTTHLIGSSKKWFLPVS